MEIEKVYNESCMSTMRRMPDNFIDLTVTSPPYDNLRSYENNSGEEWSDIVWKPIIHELFRVTKKGGVVVWIVGDATIKGNETGTSFEQALYFKKAGFRLHDTMIYNRDAMPNPAKRYSQDFEYMFILTKVNIKTFSPIMIPCKYAGVGTSPTSRNKEGILSGKGRRIIKDTKKKSNIWHYTAGANKSTKDAIAHGHPAIFPEKLARDHITSWSNEGDLVYDPFMGSGTTAKMAILNNRKWIGSESVSEYCKIAESRIAKFLP